MFNSLYVVVCFTRNSIYNKNKYVILIYFPHVWLVADELSVRVCVLHFGCNGCCSAAAAVDVAALAKRAHALLHKQI